MANCTRDEYFRDRESSLIIYYKNPKQEMFINKFRCYSDVLSSRYKYILAMFYLYSPLLESGCRKLILNILKFTNTKIKGNMGLLTALSITETQVDDISVFVPSNVISITD
ncbi:MAG: hypothetical protein ACTS8H_01330 [Arsenophonus sp. NC-PE1-MAG3]